MQKRRKQTVAYIVWLSLLLCSLHFIWPAPMTYAQDPTPTPTPTPSDDSIFDIDLPTLPTPTEILTEIILYLSEQIINQIVAWVSGLVAPIIDWVAVNWSLSNPTGLLGGLLETIYLFSLSVAGGFFVLAIILVFCQRIMITAFPMTFPYLTVTQMFGRVIVIAMVLGVGFQAVLTGLIDGVSNMALGFAAESIVVPGPSGGEWSWLPNLLFLVLANPAAIQFFGIGLILVVLTAVALFGALIIKQLGALLLIGTLPLAATAWLFKLTESIWGKYWWMLIKITGLPIILAFFLRINLVIMQTVATSSFLIASILIVVVQIAGSYVAFRFLLLSLSAVMSNQVVNKTLATVAGGTMIASGNVAGGAVILSSSFAPESRQTVKALRAVKRASEPEQ